MKRNQKIFCLVLLFLVSYVAYSGYNEIRALKKTIGHNLVLNFHSMRMTASELEKYILEEDEPNSNELLVYCGNIEKDMRLLRLALRNDEDIIFTYIDLREALLNLIDHLDDTSIKHHKDEVLKQAEIIMKYHEDLHQEAGGDEAEWYYLYKNKKLK